MVAGLAPLLGGGGEGGEGICCLVVGGAGRGGAGLLVGVWA